jgi:hypothetical protein
VEIDDSKLKNWDRSEMTLNYWMMVERYPNLKEEAGILIVGCKISSLLDEKLAKWQTAFCALTLANWRSVSKKIIKNQTSKNKKQNNFFLQESMGTGVSQIDF